METARQELRRHRNEVSQVEGRGPHVDEDLIWALDRIDELKIEQFKPPRTAHHIVWTSGSDGGKDRLNRACKEAEVNGMILVGIIPGLFGNAVAAFIGAESVVSGVKL